MRRLWPKTLTAQLVILLLLALVAAQLVTFAILQGERRGAVEALAREQVLERAATLVRLIETTSGQGERRRALRAFSTSRLRFWLADEPIVESADVALGGMPAHHLTRRLESLLADGRRLEIRVAPGEIEHRRSRPSGRHGWREQWRLDAGDEPDPDEPPAALPASGLLLAIRLDDQRWLNAAMVVPPERPAFGPAPLIALIVAAIAISLVAALSLRRLTRPLGQLAAAADAVGRGEPVAVETARGPLEIRRTALAFNAMQERIGRSLADRTRLLGAISHDLRTPITTLRLRVELVEDEGLKARMLETLDEMQALTEAGLLLARDTASEEATRAVDPLALVESVVGDFADQGQDASLASPAPEAEPIILRCRKLALTRAIRNLVENALRYGGAARVAVARGDADLSITIDDDGPGLPEAMLERVFEPFFRLEESRSKATGGSGLGLAIARSIIRGHGGDVTLANRPEGGLRALVQMPLTDHPSPGARDI